MSEQHRYSWAWPLIAVLALAACFVSLTIRTAGEKARVAAKPKQLELVHRMRVALLSVSDAQNAAVITRKESETDQLLKEADKNLQSFQDAFASLRDQLPKEFEQALISRTQERFQKFSEVNQRLADMLHQNTNRKAYALATDSGWKLIQSIEKSLAELVPSSDEPNADARSQILQPSYEIRLALLRIQAWLIPHISEPTDAAMDKLEAQMQIEEQSLDKNWDRLSRVESLRAQLTSIEAQLNEFRELKKKIVELSRTNSNIRSEQLAMEQRRDAFLACESVLVELEQRIAAEATPLAVPDSRTR